MWYAREVKLLNKAILWTMGLLDARTHWNVIPVGQYKYCQYRFRGVADQVALSVVLWWGTTYNPEQVNGERNKCTCLTDECVSKYIAATPGVCHIGQWRCKRLHMCIGDVVCWQQRYKTWRTLRKLDKPCGGIFSHFIFDSYHDGYQVRSNGSGWKALNPHRWHDSIA